MKRFIFVLLILFFTSTFIAVDVWKNSSCVEAIKKYYETVDKAKSPYQSELEKEVVLFDFEACISYFSRTTTIRSI